MKKYTPFVTLFILLCVLGYLLFAGKQRSVDNTFPSLKNNTKTSTFSLPVSQDSPNVTSVLAHYFFTGKVKKLQKVENGTKIIYENADSKLPELVVTDKTRVSKITPPYETNHSFININDIHPGQIIDISAEYDVRSSSWNILDVFFATDRN